MGILFISFAYAVHPYEINMFLEVNFPKMSENLKNPKKMKSQIHCPVSGCLYYLGSERFFTEKKLLNQHIAKVHAEKKFSCAKCQKIFGKEYYKRYHEQTCGIRWQCDCGKVYNGRETLLTHARRQQHKLPDYVLFNDKMKQNKTSSKPKDNPVIVLIQPIFQNVTCIQPTQKSVVTPRRILPKTAPPVYLTLSIPQNIVPTTPSHNDVSPVKHEQIKDNALNSVQSLSPVDSVNLASNSVFSTVTDNIPASTQEKVLRSIAIQTDDDLNNKTKARQSQASQCSRRKPKAVKVGIESTHTQTAESAVVKIKKRRSRRKSVAITTETSGLTEQACFSENSFWPGLKDFIQLGDIQGGRLFKNSASTQTSSLNSKVLCDSETITDQELLKFSWEDAMKVKENETCDTAFQMLSDIGADKIKEDETCDTNFQMLSDISGNTLKNKENDICNADFQVLTNIGANALEVKENDVCNADFQMLPDISSDGTLSVLPINVDGNSLQDLNLLSNTLETFPGMKNSIKDGNIGQTNIPEKDSLEDKSSMFSVFGDCVRSDIENKGPTLSDIHTQTMASAILDYNILANMETQTTDDFSLSDLEFSETETQTPWEDFSSLDDSPLQTDQLSIEIQTDPTFPPGLNLDPYELINSVDLQNISGYMPNMPKESLGVSTETQTLDQFDFPQFTNSESQTLDMPDFMFDSLSS